MKEEMKVSMEEVEVVAWQDAETPTYVTGERRQMHGWANDGYPIRELMTVAQHQRITEALRAEVKRLNKLGAKVIADCNDMACERDQLRAEVERLQAQLTEETQRRFDGNEISSREHREEVRRLQSQLAQQRGVPDGLSSVPDGYRLQPINEFDAYSDVLRRIGELELDNAQLQFALEQSESKFLQSKTVVPEGWKLVPVEPTPEMVLAAEEAHMPFGDMEIALRMAMLAAPAPAPVQQQGVPDGWRDAFMKMRNVAAGYSNYCEESASTRRLDREFESADELFRSISTLAAPAQVQAELTNVRCHCAREYPHDSYDAGFIAGSGMCQVCDAALPAKDISPKLAAPVQGEASQNTAQPEVAENTGSLDTTKTLIGVEAVSLSVDGVAAPDEAEKVDDIFAWATFDGEGSYDLRLYEDNETYLADWLRVQGPKYAKWVFPLYTTPPQPAPAQDVAGLLEWAVDRWHAEVASRPLANVHRRSLDDTWRQIIRHLGGDDVLLCGPRHDDLVSGQPLPPAPEAQS